MQTNLSWTRSSCRVANEGRKRQSFFIRFSNDHANKPILILVLHISFPPVSFCISLQGQMLSEDKGDERDGKITLLNYADT